MMADVDVVMSADHPAEDMPGGSYCFGHAPNNRKHWKRADLGENTHGGGAAVAIPSAVPADHRSAIKTTANSRCVVCKALGVRLFCLL